MAEADGALDKARKHKKRQLQDTLNLVIKKRRVRTYYVFFVLGHFSLLLDIALQIVLYFVCCAQLCAILNVNK